MLNMKGFLILIAFGIWSYIILGLGESTKSAIDELIYYGGNTILVVTLLYVFLIVLELFIDTEDLDS